MSRKKIFAPTVMEFEGLPWETLPILIGGGEPTTAILPTGSIQLNGRKGPRLGGAFEGGPRIRPGKIKPSWD